MGPACGVSSLVFLSRLDRAEADLGPEEREVFLFFHDPQRLERLLKLLSLEENKGKDKFDSRKFLMWKGLFRNFGSTLLEPLKPHLEALCLDQQESSQRCAAELVAGLVRGSKHWGWGMTQELWGWLVPVLRQLLSKVTVETIGDWGTCFATASESRDPNRLHWLLEVLMEEPLRSQGSFLDASRLYVLQGAVAQQEWRIGSLLHRLDAFLRPFLTHPYQNVRERLGSVVANIYALDISFPGAISSNYSPLLGPLVEEVLPQLAMMTQEPDQELYNFHRSSSRSPEDLTSEDLAKILAKLPGDLATRVSEQGLPTLKQLLAGKPPSLTPQELLARQPPPVRAQLESLPREKMEEAMKAIQQRQGQGMVPPVLQAAVQEVLYLTATSTTCSSRC